MPEHLIINKKLVKLCSLELLCSNKKYRSTLIYQLPEQLISYPHI